MYSVLTGSPLTLQFCPKITITIIKLQLVLTLWVLFCNKTLQLFLLDKKTNKTQSQVLSLKASNAVSNYSIMLLTFLQFLTD